MMFREQAPAQESNAETSFAAEFYRLASGHAHKAALPADKRASARVFSFRINYYTGLQEDLMDGIKQNEEQNDARKPVSEHITDLVAAAAGALV